MKRAVFLTGPAKRDLKRLDRNIAGRIATAIERFALSGQGDVRQLGGPLEGFCRLTVAKDWRVVFRLEGDDVMVVTRVGHRSEIYRIREEAILQYHTA